MVFTKHETRITAFYRVLRPSSGEKCRFTISSENFNRVHQQTILAMITSAGSDWQSDVAIRGWRQAGLSVPCKVRFKLFTLDHTLLIRKLGTLSEQDARAVKQALGLVLASDG